MEDKKKMWTVCKCGRYLCLDVWRFPGGVIKRILDLKIKNDDVNTKLCPKCRITSQS